MIYLDYAATNPVRPEVSDSIYQFLKEDFGNASSTYRIGKKNKVKLIQARQKMAKLLNVSSNQLYFTSGATESNNWAIFHQAKMSKKLNKGNHIVAASIEHPSVSEVLKELERLGYKVTYLAPNFEGKYSVEQFESASNDETIGWVAMAVNNEVGSILPIKELGQSAKQKNYWFHVDTVQAIGHIDLSEITPYCTTCIGSAHKFGGPKGIGFLVYQPWDEEIVLNPLIFGGGQENKLRSGTENLAYIVGMVQALELTLNDFKLQNEVSLKYSNYIIEQLEKNNIEYIINGDREAAVPHILNIWFPGYDASQLLIKLDLKEIYVSAGSACSAGSVSDSQILKAYHPNEPERWHQSLRISYGYQTTFKDIKYFIEELIIILKGE